MAIDATSVTSMSDLATAVRCRAAGDTVDLSVIRDTVSMSIDMTLTAG